MDTRKAEIPEFVKVGGWVKILDWCGKIKDIAVSENGSVILKVASFKGIWNHHREELVELNDSVTRATSKMILADKERFEKHAKKQLDSLTRLLYD